ncbi:pantoate--beta-alanine ligase [Pontibacillus halophilus JSM 076056 = DSM 19796]|uniref:Pantothenate synthetase n=1 Tax=Pontibacillus halophilus JSM 076056 = DSM 19796 TaxID=1385510 RepID=A0A0A5GJH3_9BACI|nr:pantoate--beta-alanine ligase [Pontibacillus halophilus]KGX92139.1 pantoate--beta-alanine ligase [Pontibacillus halophilus JSM 076056 = DSM 19796]
MRIFSTATELQQELAHLRADGATIGFVPTMGYLHEGHKSLLLEARNQNDIVVLSIFVNPLQFGANEDLDRYPRDEKRDMLVALETEVDFVFMPDVSDMYPESPLVTVKVQSGVDVLCGSSRPGHFDGVATVLTKLFTIIMPTRTYFGEKDAQQLAIVAGLIRDFNFPIELIPVPTRREADGLAMSSRNVYLHEDERKVAPKLQEALQIGRGMIVAGERDVETIRQAVSHFINTHTHGKIDYVDLLAYPSLERIHRVEGQVILALAVYFQQARLIDNVIMDQHGHQSTVLR